MCVSSAIKTPGIHDDQLSRNVVHLESRYGWGREEITSRTQYYALNQAPGPYNESETYAPHQWNDEAARKFLLQRGVLCGTFRSASHEGEIVLEPFKDYHLPDGRIEGAYVYVPSGDATPTLRPTLSVERERRTISFPPGTL